MSRLRRVVLGPLCAVLAALCLVAAVGGTSGAGAAGDGGLVAQPALSAPAETFLGASPGEAPGEAWATAREGSTIARYADAGGWQVLPPPVSAKGTAISGLRIAAGANAGRTTNAGGVVVAARAGPQQLLLVRDPGGGFHAAPDPGPLLEAGETLFSQAEGSSPVLAAVPEQNGHTGAYLLPASNPAAAPKSVLVFDGESWVREPICIGVEAPVCNDNPPAGFRVIAIEATAPGNAWLLARKAAPGEGLELFSRDPASGEWRQRSLGPSGSLGALFAKASPQVPRQAPKGPLTVTVSARSAGQPLTVTESGVWVDARLTASGETSDATIYFKASKGEVTQSWCDIPETVGLCSFPLAQELPSGEGRSFGWPGASPEDLGTRVITGVGDGAILSLEGSVFARVPLAGGESGSGLGAALGSPDSGWLGGVPPMHLVRAGISAEPSRLQPWPIPFRRPLLAIAAKPGTVSGSLESEAIAVGDEGQVARFVPGEGWTPEALLTAAGKRATPTMRGVAWPKPESAYAVGDEAEMWLWRASSGLWEPDPGKPPNLDRANFTGIAFDPTEPSRGYAIGKQGLLLGFGREWQQEPLPAGLSPEVNFTSIAFAGKEALVTYKFPIDFDHYGGGLLVNDGSGWRLEPAAEAVLGGVPEKVAGLPDGGAAIASAGTVGEQITVADRSGPGTGWARVAENLRGYPSALAAIREGGQVQAIVSVGKVDSGAGTQTLSLASDRPQLFNQPPPGQAPLLTHPYPLPANGFVVRQVGSVWRDEQHEALPIPRRKEGQEKYDWPARPDPILALLIAPDGSQGWAVGGVTGEESALATRDSIQTGGVSRYGPTAAPPVNFTATPIVTDPGTATFAIGGNAQCGGPCADLGGSGVGPDRWLRSAIAKAAGIPGVRAFLYTGVGVASGGEKPLSSSLTVQGFVREESAYAQRLAGSAAAMPVFAAPAETDVDRKKTLETFEAAFSKFSAPFGTAPPPASVSPISQSSTTQPYYSFLSSGSGGNVRVIVLDYSATSLGNTQQCWLAGQLSEAKAAQTPAIVMGARDLGGQSANRAADAAPVTRILVGGAPPPGCVVGAPASASAYFFDYPEEDRQYRLNSGGKSIPAFGSGTLGYLIPPAPQNHQFLGASGFLLASVAVSHRDPDTNVAPVGVRLIPNIGALALDGKDGTLLRRSQVALFEALARRPLAGMQCIGSVSQPCSFTPDPYIPIPLLCQGPKCATGVLPEYRFVSSRPDIADFVASDPASSNPRAVILGKNGKPIPDPTSGLLCAFNAGTTKVTIEAGGLAYSTPVTVQPGSVQRPCGTVPLREGAVPQPAAIPPPQTQPSEPGFQSPSGTLPPPPAPSTSAPAPPQLVHHPAPPPPAPSFFSPAPALTPVVVIVPPPPPPVVQTTPPSGTSPVTQPAVSPEPEDEEEAALDMVHHMAAYQPGAPIPAAASIGSRGGGSHVAYFLPALVLIAALAGAGLTGRRRSTQPAYAYPTASRRPRR